MDNYYALWIDHNHAFVYKYTANGVEELKIEAAPHVDHHHRNPKDVKIKPYEKFFHAVAQKLGDAKELMVMGPGEAKDQFKHHCENHHHATLAKAIVGVLPMTGHPTVAQMKEKSNEFFKHLHTFTKNY